MIIWYLCTDTDRYDAEFIVHTKQIHYNPFFTIIYTKTENRKRPEKTGL